MIEFPFKEKQIRDALDNKGSLLRVIMDSLPDCFFIKDKDLRFIGANKALAIRQENAQIPILMLTGFGDIMNEDGLCPPGVNLVLAKPITHTSLREGIAKLMSARAENP